MYVEKRRPSVGRFGGVRRPAPNVTARPCRRCPKPLHPLPSHPLLRQSRSQSGLLWDGQFDQFAFLEFLGGGGVDVVAVA